MVTMATTMNKHNLLLLLCAGILTVNILSGSAVAYGNGKIFDITHKITSELPTFESQKGLGQFIWLVSSIRNGSIANVSQFKLGTHTGTHVDAPSHFFQKYYEEGFDVTTLSLQTLNGPALVVDVPRDKNITAEVMKSLNIPRGVHRVLFRTLNTDRGLMHKKEFASNFTGFRKDGAQWLVDNTDIKLVGLDYLSVSAYVDAAPTHHIFLKKREIVLVEGLNLDGIQPGKYTVHCLPLRMVGADGCPTRCILTA
ncbi:Kynurenine formamidase/cyclase-like - like 3 [Theobroma cacao]|nr:Kynurenine formamidase/cyclase-like - like 3 [Theobroma cacao]